MFRNCNDLGKRYDMIKNNDGLWEVTTDSLTEGFHYYSLIVDGMTVADPAKNILWNGQDGKRNRGPV